MHCFWNFRSNKEHKKKEALHLNGMWSKVSRKAKFTKLTCMQFDHCNVLNRFLTIVIFLIRKE
jgi:hypothetical protein